ncbi:hypothetical protein [Mycolicibacterium nivoides]|uniref:hypothetical protein n=1 Tax=Mycolicibacterium nivoides TaxID=2487344 RepID=UPI003C2E0BF1
MDSLIVSSPTTPPAPCAPAAAAVRRVRDSGYGPGQIVDRELTPVPTDCGDTA